MSFAWKDVTSYSQGTRERIPRSFELRAGVIRVVVTRLHGCDGWYLRCDQLGFGMHQLPDDLEEAKAKAIRAARFELEMVLKCLGGAP